VSVRRPVTAVAVVAFEVWLHLQYAALGAQFHFWLHGLFGATLGLLALAAWRVVRRRVAPVAPWEAGFLGHLVSAAPDLLFLGFGVLHVAWMDVFALHISLHFVPYPLPTQLGMFLVALAAYVSAAEDRPRLALVGGVAVAAVTAVGLALRSPLPASLAELQTGASPWLREGIGAGVEHTADHADLTERRLATDSRAG
jgi:hypothetical protein